MTNIPVSERRNWIGASESAALFGVSPYTTRFELWHQKAGNIPTANLDNDERVNAGQFLEPSIAAWAHHKWNWPILTVTDYRTSPRVHRMGASLDFMAVDGREPVEIKNVDFSVFKEQWQVEDDEVIDAPAHILIQVMHQLACDDNPPECGWIIACVGGNRLYRMRVQRHDRMIQRIEQEVTIFWESIGLNQAPEPDFQADAAAISLLYGGTGGDFADLRGNNHAAELASEYLEALEVEKRGKEIKSRTLAELKVMMKDARGALMDDGYKITASHLKEQTTLRKAHWRFSVRQTSKEKT